MAGKTRALGILAIFTICSFLVSGTCELNEESIYIPTRPCAVEGSPQANGKSPGDMTHGPFTKRIDDAGRIFQAAGDLSFNSPPSGEYPVIADPYPPEEPGERLGDVDDFDHSTEPEEMKDACRHAWALISRKRGTIIVNARAWIQDRLTVSTMGGVPPVPPELRVNGVRGDDLCSSPRNLTYADVAPKSWAVVVDQALFGLDPYRYDPVLVLAHELGHTLMLGHGNGLDDNHDGQEPPQDGRRRFDEYCDPDGLSDPVEQIPVEDLRTPATTCETHSLMYYTASAFCGHLSELQIEQAREVALLIPGACKGAVCIEYEQQ